MKKILIIASLAFPIYLQAQEIPKKANTIMVKGVSFDEAASALMDHHYNIQNTDRMLQIMSTSKAKSLKHSTVYLKINVRIKDTTAIITGIASDNIWVSSYGIYSAPPQYLPIAKLGAKDSPALNAWAELNEFALSFNKPVEYLKQ